VLNWRGATGSDAIAKGYILLMLGIPIYLYRRYVTSATCRQRPTSSSCPSGRLRWPLPGTVARADAGAACGS
jgi:hypothetical protein